MKCLVLIMILIAPPLMAGNALRLGWDASTTEGVTNYVIYGNPGVFPADDRNEAWVQINAGTNLSATVPGVDSGTWAFAATAMAAGAESELSEILVVDVSRHFSGRIGQAPSKRFRYGTATGTFGQ